MRSSDCRSDVCSSDLLVSQHRDGRDLEPTMIGVVVTELRHRLRLALADPVARAADRLTLDMDIERNASQRRNATGAKTTEDRARTQKVHEVTRVVDVLDQRFGPGRIDGIAGRNRSLRSE